MTRQAAKQQTPAPKAGATKPRAAKRSRKPAATTAEHPRSAPALAEVDAEVLEFIAAIERFKLEHGRPFPSWSEVLLVVRQLGYRRS